MSHFLTAHWLLVLALVICFLIVVPLLAYRQGRKEGDIQGYIRGCKEGQQSEKQ